MPKDASVERATITVGDFRVDPDEYEAAKDAFDERSSRSRSFDRAFRSPIAPNFQTWVNAQRLFDYPGIDTPTDRPRHGLMDRPTPADTVMDDGIGVDVTAPQEVRASTAELGKEFDAGMDSLAEAIGDLDPFDLD